MGEITTEGMTDGEQESLSDIRNDIEIDTSILKQQEKTTTSLCDRFHVHIFREEAELLEENYDQEQELRREEILADVLTGKPETDRQKILKTVMEADTSVMVKKDYEDGAGAESSLSMYAYVLAGVVLAGAVLFYIEKRRKGKKQGETYSYDYEQDEEAVL